MALSFLPITDKHTLKDLTNQVNNIGSELTKNNNVFQAVDSLSATSSKAQNFKLTTDSGRAKSTYNINSLSELKEAGYYYITSGLLNKVRDTPNVSSVDCIIHVLPIGGTNDSVIQKFYSLSLVSDNSFTAFRYVSGTSSSYWQSEVLLPNNNNKLYSNTDVRTIQTPGTYYVYNCTYLPSKESSGSLTMTRASGKPEVYTFISSDTGIVYTGKNSSGILKWNKSLEITDLESMLLRRPDDSKYTIEILDNSKSIKEEIKRVVEQENQTVVTFYCGKDVKDSFKPGKAYRGIYFNDSKGKLDFGYYIIVDYWGKVTTGYVQYNDWSLQNSYPTIDELWRGSLSFDDVNSTKNLKNKIESYDAVKIYATIKGDPYNSNSGSVLDAKHVCHEFLVEDGNDYIVTGLLLGSKPKYMDFYRCVANIKGNQFYLKSNNTSVSTGKRAYVTRIVGIKFY